MEFTAEQLAIFGYLLPNGEKRFADPLEVRYVLLAKSNGEIDKLAQRSRSETMLDSQVANTKIAECVREAFGLKPVDPQTGEGAPQAYCVALFNQYLEFYDQKKTSSGPTPT